jgi:putative heme transporter
VGRATQAKHLPAWYRPGASVRVLVLSPPVEGVGGSDPPAKGPAGQDRAGGRARAAPRRSRRVKIARFVIEAVVLAGGAVFVVRRAGDTANVAATFDRLHWHWLFVSVAAEVGSITALSWLQQKLLRVGDLPVGVRELVPVTMASNAVAQSLPGGTLFAEGYSFRQYQRLGASRMLGIWAELSAGALASAALATVAVAGAIVVGPGLRLKLLPGLAIVLAGALVAAALFRRAPLLSDLISRVSRRLERHVPARLIAHLRSAQDATTQMEKFRPSKRLWLMLLAAAVINWSLDAVVLTMGLLTVGGPVPWRGLLLCYAAAQLLVELPLTPGGLGLVEGGLVEVLIRFHVPASRATAGTLMYRAVSYWLLLVVGWVAVGYLTYRNRRTDRLAAAASAASERPSTPVA